jgi:Tfp pilus assembly protein PilF
MVRARSGDTDGAIAAWQRALEIQPAAADLLFNLGLAHAQAGRSAEAVRYLESYAQRAQGPQRDRALEMVRQLRREGPPGG